MHFVIIMIVSAAMILVLLVFFSTEEKACVEGKKEESKAQKFWKEYDYQWGRPAMPTFTGMMPPKHYGDYYIKLMEVN